MFQGLQKKKYTQVQIKKKKQMNDCSAYQTDKD